MELELERSMTKGRLNKRTNTEEMMEGGARAEAELGEAREESKV